MIALRHVARSCVVGAGRENHEPVLIDAHEPAFPEKCLRELDVDFANVNRLGGR